MDIEFDDPDLERLADDQEYTAGHAPGVAKGYRKAIRFIRSAADERDFQNMRGLNFKPLDRDRQGQHSMKLNDQWRLILEIRGEAPRKRIGVVEIVDYH